MKQIRAIFVMETMNVSNREVLIPNSVPSGFLVVDKPHGWTSFDCVNKVRWIIAKELGLSGKKVKVGHCGTLDPYATGVLVLGIGKATKQLGEMLAQDKSYTASIGFGVISPTFDLDYSDVELEEVEVDIAAVQKVIPQFKGVISQIPPAYSALKIGGKRAYESARSGKEVVLEPREVMVHSFDVVNLEKKEVEIGESSVVLSVLDIELSVSKGTYIRSIARDIGESLGAPASLVALRRTQVGDFTLDGALGLGKETTYEEVVSSMLPL